MDKSAKSSAGSSHWPPSSPVPRVLLDSTAEEGLDQQLLAISYTVANMIADYPVEHRSRIVSAFQQELLLNLAEY